MDISIIIVSYNVRFFLEQTLNSVFEAQGDLKIEVFVVDNASEDASIQMVQARFPQVYCIANSTNVGFSAANNQAIRLSRGKYILLLNPDTVLQQDTLQKCFEFMETHPEGGALGVYMVDGRGDFLPESKRGLPTPLVAFFKLVGITAIFPKSKFFALYYLGHLDKNQNHEVEILSGAYMFIRGEALQKVGLLDEQFFMYGEDIDLSYRILQAGYKNYYLAETKIIHYKGESTKRENYRYVMDFYNAMILFARKHFKGVYGKLLVQLIQAGILARAMLSFLQRVISRYGKFLFHWLIILVGLWAIQRFWEVYFKNQPDYYPEIFSYIILPIYAGIWIGFVYLSGGYDRPQSAYRITRGVFFGTLLISAFSNFIDSIRYSKAVILLGTFYSTSILLVLLYLEVIVKKKSILNVSTDAYTIVVVGSETEFSRLQKLFAQWQLSIKVLGFINTQIQAGTTPSFLGNIKHLELLIPIYAPNEVIFCAKDLSIKEIIEWMNKLGRHTNIQFKIFPEKGDFVIGSGNKNTQGELYAPEFQFELLKPNAQRNKRIFDVVLATLSILCFPIFRKKLQRRNIGWKDLWDVWVGKKTMVGIASNTLDKKVCLLTPTTTLTYLDGPTKERIHFMYAQKYHPTMDAEIFFKAIWD